MEDRIQSCAMESGFSALAASRHCKRAFLPKQVPRKVLEAVLASAAHAPSSRNTQPWYVAVLTGAARDGLSHKLCNAFDSGVPPHPDFLNNPAELTGIYAERARKSAAGLLKQLGIARDDAVARRETLHRNYEFFGAPVVMVFHLSDDAVPGSFLALGCFLQNVMLGLVAHGLGSCPQYSIAGYPEVIREHLGLAADRIVVCALSVGYPDPDAPINGFVPCRASLAEYVEWSE
jgi:nitroreductase